MNRASETDAEELEAENSERSSSASGVVIPIDVPTGESVDVEDANASVGEIGRQDVSSSNPVVSWSLVNIKYS